MLSFKEWFYKEAMTSTSCVAGFARPALPGPVRRGKMPKFDELDIDNKKKKPKEQPQVKD